MIASNDDGDAVGGDDARLVHAAAIRILNDTARAAMMFRSTYVTLGVRALGEGVAANALSEVRRFTRFGVYNDPWGEHDFGSITVADKKMFWKIDYYDLQLQFGSPDPADPAVTARVLTVMLASEY
ncbi:MAG TPA: DUF3768 domain-containing protein [Sphingomicrobium sp.]|jgi:hypothetical protein